MNSDTSANQECAALKAEMLHLIGVWEKEAAGYLKTAAIAESSKPADLTPYQQSQANTAAVYRDCARQLRKTLKST